jgi:hypothetical protein
MAKQGSSRIIGLAVVCIVLAAGIGWVVVAGFHAGKRLVTEWAAEWQEHKTAAQWEELRKAVVVAGTSLVENPQMQPRDYEDEAARFVSLHNSAKLEIQNPELIKVWGQIQVDTSRGLLILEKIAEIDNNKPSGYEILAKGLKDAATDAAQDNNRAVRDFWTTTLERIRMEAEKSDREKIFRETEASLNDSVGGLQRVAAGLSGKELPNTVSVQYFPSWEGRLWGDAVEVENTSDGALDNAIVVVAVRMTDGSSKTHVHYVDHWQSGARLKAWYPYKPTDYASAQTGDNPGNVDVAVYQPGGTAKATYTLTQEKWDEIVKGYCSRLTFSGNYLQPFPGDEEIDHHSGFQFMFEGLPTLPVESVEVRFTSSTRDVRSVTVHYAPGTELRAGRFSALRSADLDGPDPSHIDYILRFSGTKYQHEVHHY